MKNKVRYFNRAYKEGKLDYGSVNQSIQSWLGHAKHGDTYHLRKNIMDRVCLPKGG